MKRSGLLYLLIFSLALNLGTIGALVYGYWSHPPARPDRPGLGFLRLLHSLNLDEQQRQVLQQHFPSHRQQLRALRQQLAAERQKLVELLSQPQPQEAEVAAQITVINNVQNALEQEMARFLLTVKAALRSDQQEVLLEQVRQRLCDPRFCRPPGGPPPGRGAAGFHERRQPR